jgi:aromatic ring-cleaving dioxygenase
MVGAAAAWNAKADVRAGIAQDLSVYAFGDPTGKSGNAFHDLGNVYLCFAKKTFNASVPWQMLFRDASDAKWVEGLESGEFDCMERRLEEIEAHFAGEAMSSPDAEIVREEFEHLLRMLRLSAEFGRHRLGGPKPKGLDDKIQETKMDHEVVWLMRNRPGGLADSESKLKIG